MSYTTEILTQALLDLHPISGGPGTVCDMADKFVLMLLRRVQRQPYPDRTAIATELSNQGFTLTDGACTIEIRDWYKQTSQTIFTKAGQAAVLQRAAELIAP